MSWPLPPAAVALGDLDERERALADVLLADDPTFRAEVDRVRGAATALAALDRTAWEPVPPPPLRADVTDAPQERAARGGRFARTRLRGRERDRTPRAAGGRRLLRAPRPLLAASGALAAAAVLAVALVVTGGDDGPSATTIALRPLAGATGRASLTIAGAEAQLRGSGLPPSGKHDYYEAWLADSRGRMVSMGTFRVGEDGRVDVHMPVAVDVKAYALVDVSLERDDGNPGHSDRSVLRADL